MTSSPTKDPTSVVYSLQSLASNIEARRLTTPLWVSIQKGFSGEEERSISSGSTLCFLALHGEEMVHITNNTGHDIYEKSTYDERRLELLPDHSKLDDKAFRSLGAAASHDPRPLRLRCLAGYGLRATEEALEEGDVIEFVDGAATEIQGISCARIRRVENLKAVGEELLVPLADEIHLTANVDQRGYLLAELMNMEREGTLSFPLRVRLFDEDGRPSKTSAAGRKYTLQGSAVEKSFVALLLLRGDKRISTKYVRLPVGIPFLTVNVLQQQSSGWLDQVLHESLPQLTELVDVDRLDVMGPPAAGSFRAVSDRSYGRSRLPSILKALPPPLPKRDCSLKDDDGDDSGNSETDPYATLTVSLSSQLQTKARSDSGSSGSDSATDSDGYMTPKPTMPDHDLFNKGAHSLETVAEVAKAYRRQTSSGKRRYNSDEETRSRSSSDTSSASLKTNVSGSLLSQAERKLHSVAPPVAPKPSSAQSSPKTSAASSPKSSPKPPRRHCPTTSKPTSGHTSKLPSTPNQPSPAQRRLSPLGSPSTAKRAERTCEPLDKLAKPESDCGDITNVSYVSTATCLRQLTQQASSDGEDSNGERVYDQLYALPSRIRRFSEQSDMYVRMDQGKDMVEYWMMKCRKFEEDLNSKTAECKQLKDELEELKAHIPRTGKPDGREKELSCEWSSLEAFSVTDVVNLLKQHNLAEYADKFANEGVSGDHLPYLTNDMLRQDFNITSDWHRLKLKRLFEKKAEGSSKAAAPP